MMIDQDNYPHDVDHEGIERRDKMRRVVIVMLLGVVITLGGVIVLARDDKEGANGSGVPEPYHHAMTTPAETLTDPQLVKTNNDLKAYNVSLQQSVADLTTQRNLAQADATKAQGEATNLQAQLDELTADKTTLQGQYDDLFARYDDGPKYDLQLKRERGWHLNFGGMVEVPIDDPLHVTPTLLIQIQRSKWSGIVGVGYGLGDNATSVSIGVTYRIL